MNHLFLAFGKERSQDQYFSLYQHYQTRIKAWGKSQFKFIKPNLQTKNKTILQDLKQTHPGHFIVGLDEKGKNLTSLKLASFIQQKSDLGINNWIWVVGPAHGFDKKDLTHCNLTLSLSSFTFPHRLAFLVLQEQVYRALSIIHKSPYHHD